MKLSDDWKEVLRKAWSIRFIILAGVLSGLEVALPYFATLMPRGTFAALSSVAIGAAFIARLVAQKGLK